MPVELLFPATHQFGHFPGVAFEKPLEGGWTLAGRVLPRRDHSELIELTIRSDLAEQGFYPNHGLTTTRQREPTRADVREVLDEIRATMTGGGPNAAACVVLGFTLTNLKTATRPGWQSTPERKRAARVALWAETAPQYQSKRQAEEALAAELKVGRSTVRGWVSTSVPRYLTASGELTEHAKGLLDGEDPRSILNGMA